MVRNQKNRLTATKASPPHGPTFRPGAGPRQRAYPAPRGTPHHRPRVGGVRASRVCSLGCRVGTRRPTLQRWTAVARRRRVDRVDGGGPVASSQPREAQPGGVLRPPSFPLSLPLSPILRHSDCDGGKRSQLCEKLVQGMDDLFLGFARIAIKGG